MKYQFQKKHLIIAASILVILVVLFKLIQIRQNAFNAVKKSITPTPTKIIPSKTTKEYADESGFKFDYPENLTVDNKTKLDKLEYANLTLKSDEVDGDIILTVTDSKFKKIDEYFKENKISTKSAKLKDVSLADLTGVEIATKKNITTIAIDSGVLYEIKTSFGNNKPFWQDVHRKIISSFEFVKKNDEIQAPSSNTEDNSSDDSVDESEEVIE